MRRLATAAAFLLLVAPARAQNADPAWPPPGVHFMREAGITAPRVLTEVKPRYTGTALGDGIQGDVLVECIVEPNGIVGPTRVVRSLDKLTGLDDEAVRAAKQWRFTPAMKDGEPVRMLVVISLSFTIADRPPAPRFPDGFADTTLDSSRWDTSTLAVDDLTIGVALPPGWMRASAVGEAVLTLNRADANFAIELSIRRLAAPRTRIAGAPTNGQLQDMRESLQRRFNADGRRAAVLSSGQFSLERRFWAWGQMSVADAAPATRQASVWWFGTDDGDDVVGVIVTVQTRPGAAPDLRSAVSTSVAPTIVEFLKRLTIAR